ncbi:hypothetical protein F4802DRAFT_603003 [Xylaria palmicola]|nr:hypothetical protein F4802DRAFT_603003 [Xylaria palmicola]
MSPITVQAARLASRQALNTPLRQQVFRRFASSNAGHAPADWGRIIKSRASTLLLFFPGMGIALGWPLIAEKLVDRS